MARAKKTIIEEVTLEPVENTGNVIEGVTPALTGTRSAPVSEEPEAQSRIEGLLLDIINDETTDIVPQSRNEALLKEIVNKAAGVDDKITELDGDVYGGFVPDYHDGFYAEYQGKALHNVNASWVYDVVDVSDFVGKTLTISTYADRTRKILFTDASDNVIDSVLIDTGNPNLYSTVTATVPTGSTKCYINKYASGQNDIVVAGYYQLKLALKTEVPMVDDEFGDNENATVSQKFITDNFANSIEAILPSSNSKIPIVDEDVPIYLDNLFRGVSPKELRLVDCNNVYIRIYDKTVAVLPSASGSGSNGIIKLHLVDDFKYEISAGVGFAQIEARTGSKKVLFIGDSITQNLSYLTPLKTLSDNGDYNLTFLGTLGTTIKHEGRQGWAAYNYANDASALGATNAFWDGEKFNFAWYISQNSIEEPDFVFINLGTNDLIRGITDPNDDEEVKAVVTSSYETIINSIRAYNANLPIILWLPPTRCMCGRNNHTGIDYSLRINKILGDTFGYITYINNKVYLMHTYLFVNPYTDYTISDVTINGVTYKDCSDPIHPTQDGGEKIAKGIMRQMKYIDSLSS